MAAPQQISFGIGSPADIGWLITFGLGDYGEAEAAVVSNAGNIGMGIVPIGFTPLAGRDIEPISFSPAQPAFEPRPLVRFK